jgi:hypothetical protein
MRRISSHIPLIAALAAVCLAGPLSAMGATGTTSGAPVNNAAINKAVQEALTKAKAEKRIGTPAAPGVGSAGASAGSSEAFSNLTAKSAGEEQETAATKTAASTTSSPSPSGAVSAGVLVPIFVVGAVLLGGIAFFIVRDSRSVAPAGDGLGGTGSARDQAARLRKRRAKAKAARQQRKRNR